MNWNYASRVLPKDGEAKSGAAVFARVDASSQRSAPAALRSVYAAWVRLRSCQTAQLIGESFAAS